MNGDNDEKVIISVVVVTYNRSKLLDDCLMHLTKQTLDSRLYEVIIVDNNSTDDTKDVVKKYTDNYGNFRYCLEGKQGSAPARNRGWKEAASKYVAYIDDDANCEPSWCEEFIKDFLTVVPTPAAVGGMVLPRYEAAPPAWFADDFEIRSWGDKARFLKHRESFVTMNVAVKKDLFLKYGGFAEHLGPINKKPRMGDDTEFFYRVFSREPFFWYDPKIVVHHWTPIGRMRVAYRWERSIKAGEAIALIDKRKIFSISYLRKIAILFFIVIRLPVLLLFKKRRMTELVIQIENFGYVVGYLKI